MQNRLLVIALAALLLFTNIANAKIVGITTDYRDNKNGEHAFARTSFYALRDNYISSFQKACKKYGVTVFVLPLDQTMVQDYSKILDGLVVTGNYYDVNPKLYGQKILNDTVKVNDYKGDFELALFKSFYKTKKPIFGICGGYQLINVALGGELYQDIPSQLKESTVNHASEGGKLSHKINILENSGVFAAAAAAAKNGTEIYVNSSHHQGISEISNQLEVTALAPDSLIEAYKAKDYPFLIGVQWHPEYELSKFDSTLIEEFCQAVAK